MWHQLLYITNTWENNCFDVKWNLIFYIIEAVRNNETLLVLNWLQQKVLYGKTILCICVLF